MDYEKYTKPADMNKDLNLYIAQWFVNKDIEDQGEIYSWSGLAKEISEKGTLETREKLMYMIMNSEYTPFPDLEDDWFNLWRRKGVKDDFVSMLQSKIQIKQEFQSPPHSLK